MLKEFGNQAVVTDSNGEVLRQLAKNEKGSTHLIEQYFTKKEAGDFAHKMGLKKNSVRKICINKNFGMYAYAILWDCRYDYYIACWD